MLIIVSIMQSCPSNLLTDPDIQHVIFKNRGEILSEFEIENPLEEEFLVPLACELEDDS